MPSFAKRLSRLSIGTACRTCLKPAVAFPPTRCVGESGVISSGMRRFERRNSRKSASYSCVGNRRRGFVVVAPVVFLKLPPELRRCGRECRA